MYNIEGARWFLEKVGGPEGLKGKRVCELGNQHVWVHAKIQCGIPFDVARDWFLSLGVAEYVSVDLNGQDGAEPFDLSCPPPARADRLMGRFDVVTDHGTLEHVEPLEGQYQAFRWTHDLCAVGGIMLHLLPPVKQWGDHCRVRYRDNLGLVLAGLNGYGLVESKRLNLYTLNAEVDYLVVALRKLLPLPFTKEKAAVLAACEWREPWGTGKPPEER